MKVNIAAFKVKNKWLFQFQFYMNKMCWQIINQSEVKKNSVA